MMRFLSNLFRARSSGTEPMGDRPANRLRPALEVLDGRLVPTVVYLDGSNLWILGTDLNDSVSVVSDASTVTVTSNNPDEVRSFSRAAVGQILFHGYGGHDYFDNWTSIPSFADGGSGHDTLLGGFAVDVFYGGSGNDWLDGWDGDDLLQGGDGDDQLYGGTGRDGLYGDSYEPDLGYWGFGNDQLFGGTGPDFLHGGAGADLLDGGYDRLRDTLVGGTGADQFVTHWTWVPGPIVWWPEYEYEYHWDFDSAAGDLNTYVEH